MTTPAELRKWVKDNLVRRYLGFEAGDELLAFAAAWESDLAKLRAAVPVAGGPILYVLKDGLGMMYWSEDCIWEVYESAVDALHNQQQSEPDEGWRIVPLYEPAAPAPDEKGE